MKNLTLLRLAGFGFFGVTFLSPGSTEKKNWLIDELNATRLFTDLPFTSSAFCQETNYPKKSEEPRLNYVYQAVETTPALTEPLTTSSSESSVTNDTSLPEKRWEGKISKKTARQPMENKSSGQVTESPDPINNSGTDSSSILMYSPTSKENTDTISYIHEQTPEFSTSEEEILPPTDYVDEVKKSKFTKQVQSFVPIISTAPELALDYYPQAQMANRIDNLADFAEELGFSGKYAFLINLGLKSGKKRFFIIDLEKRSVYSSGLVAHGRGNEKFTLDKKYSNKSGSSCSSLGLYKIGSSYYGSFGKSFRLLGLEKSNNNALSRAIVLHSMGCIPDEEIEYPICQSEGCPSVSPSFLQQISKIITSSHKPVLLWVFDPTRDEEFSP